MRSDDCFGGIPTWIFVSDLDFHVSEISDHNEYRLVTRCVEQKPSCLFIRIWSIGFEFICDLE